MPIDARIPLGVTPIDPNSFSNALAAGMKMREVQQAGQRLDLAENRLARKDELATADAKALQNYLSSPRTPEDDKAFAAASPGGYLKTKKTLSEADNNAAQARNNQLTWAKANHEVLVNASGAMLANPTRANVNAILDDVERLGKGAVDMSGPRNQLASGPDEAIPGYIAGWAANATKIKEMALAEENAKPKPHWDGYNQRYVNPPGSRQATAPAAGPVGPKPRPTIEPGGSSGYSTDEIRAEIARVDQGGAPSEHFAMSREELGNLLQAQTDLETAQGGAPAPVDGQPAPVGGPQAPVPPLYRTPAQRDQARDEDRRRREAVLDARGAEELKLKERGVAAQEARARPGGQPKLTEAQGKATAFAMRGTEANQQLDAMESGIGPDGKPVADGPYRPDTGTQVGKWAGGMAGSPNRFLSPTGQRYEQAKLNFLTAQLRLESGATIPPGEIETGNQQYFAMPGDSDEVLAQKKQNRATAMKAMDVVAGPGRAGSASPVQVTPQSDQPSPRPVKVAPLEDLADMPMPGGKYAGKWARDPSSGIVYRSDGRNWIKQPQGQ